MTAAWAVPFVTIALTQVAVIATSIYLHRALAHRSLHVHPLADVGFRTALWLRAGQCRQQWVAVHRKHHTFADRCPRSSCCCADAPDTSCAQPFHRESWTTRRSTTADESSHSRTESVCGSSRGTDASKQRPRCRLGELVTG